MSTLSYPSDYSNEDYGFSLELASSTPPGPGPTLDDLRVRINGAGGATDLPTFIR